MVKGVNFVNLRDAGDPVELAARYDAMGADELVFLDITASHEQRDVIVDVVARVAEQVFIPFTVGGGIRAVDDFRRILRAGPTKWPSIPQPVQRPEILSEAAEQFGRQCVVIAIDPKRVGEYAGRFAALGSVFVHGGRTPTGLDALEWAQRAGGTGRGRNPADKHGSGRHANRLRPGIDASRCAACRRFPSWRPAGAGTPQHCLEAVTTGQADAALIASMVHDGHYTITVRSKCTCANMAFASGFKKNAEC